MEPSGDDEEEAREDVEDDPLDDGTLPTVTGREDASTTSLTSFLSKAVPRRPTPIPAQVVPPPARPRKPVARPEPLVKAHDDPVPGTTEPTQRIRTDPAPRRKTPYRIFLVLGALVFGALLAWWGAGTEPAARVAGSDAAEGPEPLAGQEASAPTAFGSSTAAETAAETESGATLAVLPATSPEILAQNTWVRRNRAAELRTEARRLYAANRWEDAQRELLLSLEWDPSNVDAQRNVSRTFQQMHEMNQAIAWTRRGIVTDPLDPRSHELLGDQLLMMGQDAEAAAAYRAGLVAAPSDRRLRSRLRRME